jgi:hypothetical protein
MISLAVDCCRSTPQLSPFTNSHSRGNGPGRFEPAAARRLPRLLEASAHFLAEQLFRGAYGFTSARRRTSLRFTNCSALSYRNRRKHPEIGFRIPWRSAALHFRFPRRFSRQPNSWNSSISIPVFSGRPQDGRRKAMGLVDQPTAFDGKIL